MPLPHQAHDAQLTQGLGLSQVTRSLGLSQVTLSLGHSHVTRRLGISSLAVPIRPGGNPWPGPAPRPCQPGSG